MRIQILTIFPELFGPFLETALLGRARERGLLSVEVRDLRDWSADRHRSVDDEPFGGGGGMVMTAPPWLAAVRALSAGAAPWRILMSPQGRRLVQVAHEWPNAQSAQGFYTLGVRGQGHGRRGHRRAG